MSWGTNNTAMNLMQWRKRLWILYISLLLFPSDSQSFQSSSLDCAGNLLLEVWLSSCWCTCPDWPSLHPLWPRVISSTVRELFTSYYLYKEHNGLCPYLTPIYTKPYGFLAKLHYMWQTGPTRQSSGSPLSLPAHWSHWRQLFYLALVIALQAGWQAW